MIEEPEKDGKWGPAGHFTIAENLDAGFRYRI